MNKVLPLAGAERVEFYRRDGDPNVVPTRVSEYEPAGIDYTWVMQVTFVLTIVLGAPIVAILSIPATLPTWFDRVEFAIRIGAMLWVLIALPTLLYEAFYRK